MNRLFAVALAVTLFSGCMGMRLRVVDESTDLPIPNVKVTATPIGVFPPVSYTHLTLPTKRIV